MVVPVDLSVDLAPERPGGLRLSNPIMIASGTFGYDGYGRGIAANAPLGSLGAVLPKTLTRNARAGNPEPRWFPSHFGRAWRQGKLRC